MDEDKQVTKLPATVHTVLEELTDVWANEFLDGLPMSLMYVFFLDMEKSILAETNRILKTFQE